jgi:biofilm PGA synthesis N-glycosyltransferase PgaC
MRYVIISPVRDEEAHIEATIGAVTAQTALPLEWVIVDDGSSDRTGQIIDEYAARIPWIKVIRRPNRGFRKSGGGVVEAFYGGFDLVQHKAWEFVVKLDGDLTFSPDYFSRTFEYFSNDPRLGIGGGDIYHDQDGELKLEKNPRFHVRGATKIYRRACWEAIGGLLAAPGWDTIDEVKANMMGWSTYAFEDLKVLHHRYTGDAEGQLRDKVKHGVACYVSGYHPLFVAASCCARIVKKPYVVGAAAVCCGFLKGYLTGLPRVRDPRLIDYLRTQQLRRLCGLESIWK